MAEAALEMSVHVLVFLGVTAVVATVVIGIPYSFIQAVRGGQGAARRASLRVMHIAAPVWAVIFLLYFIAIAVRAAV